MPHQLRGQSTGLVNQGSRVQISDEARILIFETNQIMASLIYELVGPFPIVARHIFEACPVWIHSQRRQSNFTNIIFTLLHNTNTANHDYQITLISMELDSDLKYQILKPTWPSSSCIWHSIVPAFQRSDPFSNFNLPMNTKKLLEPRERFEHTTFNLRDHCSTPELDLLQISLSLSYRSTIVYIK